MSKSLKDLSIDECRQLYLDMIKNSDRRWKAAKLMAKNEDYGGAIRDHITSMEEMIKGFIIFMDSRGFQFRKVDGMESIIRRSHSIRHFLGFVMFGMNIFMEDLIQMLVKVKEDPTIVKNIIANKEELEKRGKRFALKKIILIKKEFHWFKKVEPFRQEGSHVDFDPMVKSPLNISQEDYNEVYKRLKNVRMVCFEIIESFFTKDPKTLSYIEEFKQQFITEGWYTQMEKPLLLIKKRKNPFDLLQKFFSPLTPLDKKFLKLSEKKKTK